MKQPNAFGLYDMQGNISEWCHDVWDEDAYCSRVDGVCDPKKAIRDADYQANPEFQEDRVQRGAWNYSDRVLRGGAWIDGAGYCRSAFRIRLWPGYRFGGIGFRLALVPGPVKGRA